MSLTHKGTAVLTTPRLVLRPFVATDAEAMFNNWASDPVVTHYLTWPAHASVEVSSRICEGWVENYAKNDNYHWAITLNGEAMGSVKVAGLDDRRESAELGWCISRRLWGQGYMTEAATAIVDYLFGQCGFYRLVAKHAAENVGSGRVMQKLGMRLEGIQVMGELLRDGTRMDMMCYAILREEWRRRQC